MGHLLACFWTGLLFLTESTFVDDTEPAQPTDFALLQSVWEDVSSSSAAILQAVIKDDSDKNDPRDAFEAVYLNESMLAGTPGLGSATEAMKVRYRGYRGYRAPRTYNYNRSSSRSYSRSRSYARTAPRVRPPNVRAPITRAPRVRAAPRAMTSRPIMRTRPIAKRPMNTRRAIAPKRNLNRTMRNATRKPIAPRRMSQQMRRVTPRSMRTARSAAFKKPVKLRAPRVSANRYAKTARGAVRRNYGQRLARPKANMKRQGAALASKRGVEQRMRSSVDGRSKARGSGRAKKSQRAMVMAMGKRTPFIMNGGKGGVRAYTSSNKKRSAMMARQAQQGVASLNVAQKKARKRVANQNVNPKVTNSLMKASRSKNAYRVNVKTPTGTLKRVNLSGTLKRIAAQRKLPRKVRGRNDGKIFDNGRKKGHQQLPQKYHGYYREYTHHVKGSSKNKSKNTHRIVVGNKGEIYYTSNHYKSFSRLN